MPTPTWQTLGYSSEAEYQQVLDSLKTFEASGRINSQAASIYRTMPAGKVRAIMASIGRSPERTLIPQAPPTSPDEGMDASVDEYIRAETESRTQGGRIPLSEASREQIVQTAREMSERSTRPSGEASGAWWHDLTTPGNVPGLGRVWDPASEWPIVTALRPQVVLSKEETDRMAAARKAGDTSPVLNAVVDATTEPGKYGTTTESTVGWVARVLSAPASGIVGLLDPDSTIAERVALGEGFSGGTRDIVYAVQDKDLQDKERSFSERTPLEKGFAGLGFGLGFVGDVLLPLDLGVGDAGHAASLAAKVAKAEGGGRIAQSIAAATAGGAKLARPFGEVMDPRLAALARVADPAERAALATKIMEEIPSTVTDVRVGDALIPRQLLPTVRKAVEDSPLPLVRREATRTAGGVESINLDSLGPMLKSRLGYYLRTSGTLDRLRAVDPALADAMGSWASGKPQSWDDFIRTASGEAGGDLPNATWNKVVEAATEAEALKSPLVRDLRTLAESATPAERELLHAADIRRGIAYTEPVRAASAAARWTVDKVRDALGWSSREADALSTPIAPALEEWVATTSREIGSAPEVILRQLREARRSTGSTRAAFDKVVDDFMRGPAKPANLLPKTGDDLTRAADVLSSLFPSRRQEVRELLVALSKIPGTRVHEIASAMTRGASVGGQAMSPADVAAKVIASLKGQRLSSLAPTSDIALLTGSTLDAAVPHGRILEVLVNTTADPSMTRAPIATIAAAMVQHAADEAAGMASRRLLGLMAGVPGSGASIRKFVISQVDQIMGMLKNRGVPDALRGDVTRYVVEAIVAKMSGKSSLASAADLERALIAVGVDAKTATDAVSKFEKLPAMADPLNSIKSFVREDVLGGLSAPLRLTDEQIANTIQSITSPRLRAPRSPGEAKILEALQDTSSTLSPQTAQSIASRLDNMVGGLLDENAAASTVRQLGDMSVMASISDDMADVVPWGASTAAKKLVSDLLETPIKVRSESAKLVSGASEALATAGMHPLQTIGGLARSGMLGGYWLPNLAYHVTNALTAPAIIWGVMGGPRALGALWKMRSADKVATHIYGQVGGRLVNPSATEVILKLADGRTYTVQDIAQLALREGALSGQVSAELTTSIIEDVIRWTGRTAGGRDVGKVRDLLRRTMDPRTMGVWSGIGQTMDARFRIGVMLDALSKGSSEAEAVDLARKALFDYGDLMPWERASLAKAIWFYRFLRHSITSLGGALLTNPSRVKGLLKVTMGLPLEDKDRDLVFPEYAESKPLVSILKDKQTQERYALMGPAVPMADAVREVAGIIHLADALSDPEYQGVEKLTAMGEDVANDLASRMGPFVSLVFDLVTGERPEKGGARRDSTYLDPRYILLLKESGLWDAFTSIVPVDVSVQPGSKERTLFDGVEVRVQDTPEARRAWAAVQDVSLGLGFDRAIRDAIGPTLALISPEPANQVTPGSDLIEGDWTDLPHTTGVMKRVRLTPESAQRLSNMRNRMFDIRDRTPAPPKPR